MSMSIIKRICYICKEEFITNSNNHGITYKNNKMYVCKKCMFIKAICFNCKKEILVKFYKKDKHVFCSKLCQINFNHKLQKQNKTSFYNDKTQKQAQKQAHTPEKEKSRNEINKKNKTGVYRIGFFDNMKKKKLGIFNLEHQISASKTSHAIVKLNIKKFISSNITIDLFINNSFSKIIPADYESFNKYNNISGVWAIWGENSNGIKVCLDVCQTKNIGNEMRLGMRKSVIHKVSKYKEFVKYKNIFFILVKIHITIFKDRELIEIIYAIKNNSLYWYPSPTQMKLIKLDNNNLIEFIEKSNIE